MSNQKKYYAVKSKTVPVNLTPNQVAIQTFCLQNYELTYTFEYAGKIYEFYENKEGTRIIVEFRCSGNSFVYRETTVKDILLPEIFNKSE